MTHIIAITGKGGTGKTALAALLVKQLAGTRGAVLAIDADPDSNLPETLGVDAKKTVGDMREYMLNERKNMPPDMDKELVLESKIYEVLEEFSGYDLLVMGRPEGSGCYCFANNLLRGIMDRIIKNYDIVIIDTAAGLEHLSRGIIKNVDSLLIVTDGSRRGLHTAERIRELANELDLGFKDMYVVVSKTIPEHSEIIEKTAKDLGLSVVGSVPFDDEVAKFDLDGVPLTSLPESNAVYVAVSGIISKLGL